MTFIRSVALLACCIFASAGFGAEDRIAARRAIAPDYDGLVLATERNHVIPVIVRHKALPSAGPNPAKRREAGGRSLATAMALHGMHAFAEFRRSGMSAWAADARRLGLLIDSGLVEAVWESKPREPHLQQSNNLIDSQVARDHGLYGSGAVVVILDSGIDADHSTFDDRVVTEACFSTTWSRYRATHLCPAGTTQNGRQYVQTGSGSAALTKCDTSDCWHGTHVASIAAGSNSTYTGIAPQADIIAIQVFSRFDSTQYCGSGNSPCILSFDHDQLAAVEHVADLATTYNIAAVNMSLGGDKHQSVCDSSEPILVPAIGALKSLDIVVAASSGNQYWSDAMGTPACLSDVISVGSVHDSNDRVSSFSNSASFLDVLAPGETITAAFAGGGYIGADGTSMASPHVAGAIALLKAYDETLSHAEIRSLLLDNGVAVRDNRNGLTFPRLDLEKLTLAVAGGPAGDANHDSKVDITDLFLVQQHLRGVVTLPVDAVRRCDVYPAGNPDGILDISDLMLLQNIVVGN